jgi:hypothetical protein
MIMLRCPSSAVVVTWQADGPDGPSAWESDRSSSLTALTWAADAPLVTVIDPATPGLMARQWPVMCCSGLACNSRLPVVSHGACS